MTTMEENMKTLISSTAAILAISMTPAIAAANSNGYDAHERCKKNEDSRQVLGGVAGAVIGGVVGSQVSGNGARTEGSAIGAVLGGLAGVGIADKTVDCDPVYAESETVYSSQPAGQYGNTTQYGAVQYGTPQHSPPQYGSTSYGSTTTYGSSQPYYEDRVTVSNHPVYSNPTYGAGGVSQGTTYSTGTVSYPPSGNNSQYAYQTVGSTYGARDYTSPSSSGGYYSTTQPTPQRVVYSQPVSQPAVYTQPATHRTVYTQPAPVRHVRPHRRRSAGRAHYHGRYSCDMGH